MPWRSLCPVRAHASSCHISLTIDNDSLLVRVDDDSLGIPPGCRPGIGIGSMRERAHELGGTFFLIADPGGGSRLTARLPQGPQRDFLLANVSVRPLADGPPGGTCRPTDEPRIGVAQCPLQSEIGAVERLDG